MAGKRPRDKPGRHAFGGIAGAVGINFITDTTRAYIHDEGVVDVHEANLSSDDASRLVSATGGLAIANQSGADNSGTFAGAFSLNQLNGATLAFVDGPTLRVRKEPGDEEEKLTLTATREGDLIAAAAGIGPAGAARSGRRRRAHAIRAALPIRGLLRRWRSRHPNLEVWEHRPASWPAAPSLSHP